MGNHSRSFTLVTVSAALLVPAAEAQTVLQVSVDTDQSQYFLGEPILASVEVCNTTNETVVESYSGRCDRDQFQVYDETGTTLVAYSDFGPWCLPFNPYVELDPGECQVIANWQWPQRTGGFPETGDGVQVSPGIYSVIANYIGTTTDPAAFEILAAQQTPPIPTLGIPGMILLALALGLGGTILVWRSG